MVHLHHGFQSHSTRIPDGCISLHTTIKRIHTLNTIYDIIHANGIIPIFAFEGDDKVFDVRAEGANVTTGKNGSRQGKR